MASMQGLEISTFDEGGVDDKLMSHIPTLHFREHQMIQVDESHSNIALQGTNGNIGPSKAVLELVYTTHDDETDIKFSLLPSFHF
jgi:hypothetical protein